MSKKGAETFGQMLFKADDASLENILDPVLGYKTHRSFNEPMQNIDCVPKIMRDQERFYRTLLRNDSRIIRDTRETTAIQMTKVLSKKD